MTPNQNLQYAYDANGNRTQTIINGVTTAYTTNNLNEYTRIGSTTLRYDADGNLIASDDGSGSITTYSYNDLNQLTGVSSPGDLANYQYDVFGYRNTGTRNGETTQYVFDPLSGNVASAYAGSSVTRYTFGLGLTSSVGPGGTSYYDFDGLGSIVGITAPSGTYSNRYSYLPFGETTTLASAIPNPFTFAGQYGVMASGGGLSQMGARYYDSVVGRFTSPEPLGLGAGDANLRRYVHNDPISRVDPTGYDEWIDVGSQKVWVRDVTVYGMPRGATGDNGTTVFGDPVPGITTIYLNTDSPYYKQSREDILAHEKRHVLNEQANPSQNEIDNEISAALAGAASAKINGHDAYYKNQMDKVRALRNGHDYAGTPGSRHDAPLPPTPGGTPGGAGSSGSAGSQDPNDKFGPSGFGPQAFIAPDLAPNSVFSYRIDFENEAAATAPAQRVSVNDQLDSHLDWNTLSLTEVGFGDNLIILSAGLQHYQTTVAMTYNGQTFDVQIELSLNPATGLLMAVFQSIDPNTSLPPEVLTGFLPPEDGTGRGMAHFSYSVAAKPGLPTGTEIRNVALIQFDGNPIIATNQVNPHDPSQGTDPAKEALNTIDAGNPTSSVTALPANSPGSFVLSWSGADDAGGSGIASFDVFVSDNGGSYTAFLSATTQTSATFSGSDGHSYRFYSVATDQVGNRQATPAAVQASTRIDAVAPTSAVSALPAFTATTSFTISWSGSDNDGGAGIASFDVFVSDNGAAFTALVTGTTQTSTTFTGLSGHTYGFYSVATDNVGNRQATPTQAQATTTVDATPPTSSVTALPAFTPSASFTVSWSGSDNSGGSGIASFDIFVSDNGGTFTPFLSGTSQTSATFTGQLNHTYGFFSVATDRVGNRQLSPLQAQTTTQTRPASFTVSQLGGTATGFTILFSQPFDASTLNLYDQGGTLGPADLSVVGTATGPVTGSVVVGSDNRLTFIRTGGRLAPDTYTITLRSAGNGFKDMAGNLLDGNGDGTSGSNDDYVSTFTIAATPANAVVLSIPDFARGFGQAVNLPATGTGLPITLSTGRNVSSVHFTLLYDTALLAITGFVAGSQPAGATATVDTSGTGQAVVSVSTSGAELTATDGTVTLIRLTAQVPGDAPYRAKEILDLANPSILDASAVPQPLPAIADDGIHVSAYFGDTNGDHRYNAPDAILVQRIIAQLNTGFSAYPLADPSLLADISLNGQLQSSDVAGIQQAIVQIAVTNIPSLPASMPGPIQTSLDPRVFIPRNLESMVGGSVTVPVLLEVTEAAGITVAAAEVALEYDAGKLVVSNARLGSLLTGFTAAIDTNSPGQVVFSAWSLAGTDLLPFGTSGALFLFDVTVKADAAVGPVPLNLRATLEGHDTELFDRDLQELSLVPPPTDRWDDLVDGLLTVLQPANPLEELFRVDWS